MKIFKALIIAAAFVAFYPGSVSAQQCAQLAGGGETPTPLGSRSPIQWDRLNGYWSDSEHAESFYRIVILEVFKDGSRNVEVEVLNQDRSQVIATGVGFVRAGSWELWARVIGDGIDRQVRIQSFYPKDKSKKGTRILQATVQNLGPQAEPCFRRHTLRKLADLEESLHTSVE